MLDNLDCKLSYLIISCKLSYIYLYMYNFTT